MYKGYVTINSIIVLLVQTQFVLFHNVRRIVKQSLPSLDQKQHKKCIFEICQ